MQWKSVAIKQQLRADLSAAADDSKLLLPVKINVPPSIDPIHRTSTFYIDFYLSTSCRLVADEPAAGRSTEWHFGWECCKILCRYKSLLK